MKTTRPIFPSIARSFTTERLLIRPMQATDVTGYNILRTQPEVMLNTVTGLCDTDIAATQTWLDRFLPIDNIDEAATFSFTVEELASPGVVIGNMGCFGTNPQILGYMFRKEYWGKGYATESLKGWLEEYWSLPRTEFDAPDATVENIGKDGMEEGKHEEKEIGEKLKKQNEGFNFSCNEQGREVLLAWTESKNKASQRILEKTGFVKRGEKLILGDWRGPANLYYYVLERPE